jgi:hypothetical protein
MELQKRQIIELCKNILQDRANNAKAAMDDLQQSANEYGIPRDKYDSFKAQTLQKKDMIAKQYQSILEELILLDKIDLEKKSEIAEFGSIVITNKQKMIISVSLGKIQFDKETYVAISPNVPIFKVIQGLKKGDEFTFNGNAFKILDVF